MFLLVITLAFILWAAWNSRVGVLHHIQTVIVKIQEDLAWQMPEKKEPTVEFFRTIHGRHKWCVQATA